MTAQSSGPGRIEFIFLISIVMMIVAFAIDSMLPALPAIGAGLAVADANDRQLVVSVFLLGFGVAQLFVGVLSDWHGRRAPMLWSLVGFSLASLAASLAPTFEHLLVARFVQGIFAAGARVVVTSVVRDRFEGREMAQVMSLAGMIFMAAPILAPAMGQIVLEFGPWRWIFGVLALIGLMVWVWIIWRLPETLDQDRRIPINWPSIRESVWEVVSDRMSLGYSLCMAVISCALFSFLMMVQQIFEVTFDSAHLLPQGFAVMALGMAAASLLNASIVRRYGMRLIGHLALIFFIILAGIHAVVALTGHETLYTFIALQTVMMMGFSLVAGNFGAMAMDNMGRVAGMATSIQGSVANVAGSIIGTMIGQTFDGTTAPLYIAMFIAGLVALAIVFMTEGGRLFVARHPERAPEQGEI
jgi:MFS transporter, DHA1 family, multidrug resistance protein